MKRLTFITNHWRTGHYLLAGALWFLVVLLGVVIRNFDAIIGVYDITGSVTASSSFTFALLGGITTLLSPIGAISLVLLGLLLGINTVLLIQYIARKRQQTICIDFGAGNRHLALGGTVASIFGIGCAACGSAILFGLLNILGAGSLLLWLPLHGEEFSIIGLVLLSYATWVLLGKMYATRPNVKS
jgi:hypothetical protein